MRALDTAVLRENQIAQVYSREQFCRVVQRCQLRHCKKIPSQPLVSTASWPDIEVKISKD